MELSYSFMVMQLLNIFIISATIVLLILLIVLSFKGIKALDIYIKNNRQKDRE